MSGGRKGQNFVPFARPESYVHPSLQRSTPTASQRDTGSSAQSSSTVNAQLAHLRRTQGRLYTPPVHDSPSSGSQMSLGVPRRPQRAAAGPPPPRSWIEPKSRGLNVPSPLSKAQAAASSRLAQLDSLPGVNLPPPTSLEHQTLKALAVDFEWHISYDHAYLSVLPVRLKVLLLSYISKYRPIGGVTLHELRVLFADEHDTGLAESTGGADLERLDFSRSVAHTLYLKELEVYLFGNRRRSKLPGDTFDCTYLPDLPESWMSSDIPSSISSPLRFPHLTSLSLAYPGSSTSWSELLQFSRNLGALTRLSLAKWPAPSLPTVANSAISRAGRPRDITNLNDEEDAWADATHMLKLLSRNTPCLRWLNLDSCHSWLPAARHACELPSRFGNAGSAFVRRLNARRGYLQRLADVDLSFTMAADDQRVSNEAEDASSSSSSSKKPFATGNPWTTSWRHLTHLVIRQETPIPTGIEEQKLRELSKFQPTGTPAPSHPSTPPKRLAASPISEPTVTPLIQTSKQIENRLQRNLWIRAEEEVFLLADRVNRTRVTAGQPVLAVDRGWTVGEHGEGVTL